MPAFCCIRHDEAADPPDYLDAMSVTLAPARLNGSVARHAVSGGTLLIWTRPHTPVDLFSHPNGGTAMILGEAFDNDAPRQFTAEDAFNDWRRLIDASGYFCWLVVRVSGEVHVGADPQGLFPLYSLQGSGAFAVATSTAVLRCHPRFNDTLDLVGLARHLIENGCSSPRTLEQGSRRLQPGEVVHLRDGSAGEPEILDHSIRWLSEEKITDANEAVALSIEMSEAAYKRHTLDPQAMLMSGGVDTRQLGALAMRSGHRPDGYTFGDPIDFESVLARRVCRTVGGRWHILPDHLLPGRVMVEEELSLLSLAGGFNALTFNGVERVARAGVSRVTTGLVLDAHYSPMFRTPSEFDPDTLAYGMDVWINGYGVPVGQLLRMARPGDMQEAVQEAVREIEREWEAFPGDRADRIWQVIGKYRVRPHLASHVWRCAFHAWPQMIGTDVPLIKATRRVSGDIIHGRYLQRQTVAELSPTLARIPLTTFKGKPEGILPGRWNGLHHRLHLLQLRRAGITPPEAHRYPRIMGLDSPVWTEARDSAESGRELAEALFDPEALRHYLPQYPERPAQEFCAYPGPWGLRNMVGLMLWLARRGKV